MQMPRAQELLYAVVGAGDFAIEKAKNTRNLTDRKKAQKVYKDFVKRGRSLSNKIGTARPTTQAVQQTKAARSQVKAAATSVAKAVRANSKATGAAAKKAAKAS